MLYNVFSYKKCNVVISFYTLSYFYITLYKLVYLFFASVEYSTPK